MTLKVRLHRQCGPAISPSDAISIENFLSPGIDLKWMYHLKLMLLGIEITSLSEIANPTSPV